MSLLSFYHFIFTFMLTFTYIFILYFYFDINRTFTLSNMVISVYERLNIFRYDSLMLSMNLRCFTRGKQDWGNLFHKRAVQTKELLKQHTARLFFGKNENMTIFLTYSLSRTQITELIAPNNSHALNDTGEQIIMLIALQNQKSLGLWLVGYVTSF